MGGRAAGFCATPPPAPVDNWSDLWINCGQAVLGHYPLGKVGAALRVKHLLSNGTTNHQPTASTGGRSPANRPPTPTTQPFSCAQQTPSILPSYSAFNPGNLLTSNQIAFHSVIKSLPKLVQKPLQNGGACPLLFCYR